MTDDGQRALFDAPTPPKPAAWEAHDSGKQKPKPARKPVTATPPPRKPAPWPTDEATLLDLAQRGEVPRPPLAVAREWALELLREAEGRALEFGHHERADRFRDAINKLTPSNSTG